MSSVLSSVQNKISVAFVFGSVARGKQQANSNIDVMLAGNLNFGDAYSICMERKPLAIKLSQSALNKLNYFMCT